MNYKNTLLLALLTISSSTFCSVATHAKNMHKLLEALLKYQENHTRNLINSVVAAKEKEFAKVPTPTTEYYIHTLEYTHTLQTHDPELIALITAAGLSKNDHEDVMNLIASRNKYQKWVVDYIAQANKENSKQLHTIITAINTHQNNNSVTTAIMIAAGYKDVNEQDDLGVTALMNAASYGDIDAVRYFLGAGAQVNMQDNNGNTAFDYLFKNHRDAHHYHRDSLETYDVLRAYRGMRKNELNPNKNNS